MPLAELHTPAQQRCNELAPQSSCHNKEPLFRLIGGSFSATITSQVLCEPQLQSDTGDLQKKLSRRIFALKIKSLCKVFWPVKGILSPSQEQKGNLVFQLFEVIEISMIFGQSNQDISSRFQVFGQSSFVSNQIFCKTWYLSFAQGSIEYSPTSETATKTLFFPPLFNQKKLSSSASEIKFSSAKFTLHLQGYCCQSVVKVVLLNLRRL